MTEDTCDHGDKVPLYLQFAQAIRGRIDEGEIDAGSAIPSERDLSKLMGMSRVTVRRGIDELIAEGLLERRHGSGTFVKKRIEAAGNRLSGFSADSYSRGERPEVFWLFKSRGTSTEEEARALEIGQSTPVVRLSRVRLSEGEPLAIEHAVVPAEFLPDLDALRDSLYTALDATGSAPVSGEQRTRASLANPTEAGILCIPEDSEVLRIERITREKLGRPVEFTRSTYRGDRYVFVTELNPRQSN